MVTQWIANPSYFISSTSSILVSSANIKPNLSGCIGSGNAVALYVEDSSVGQNT